MANKAGTACGFGADENYDNTFIKEKLGRISCCHQRRGTFSQIWRFFRGVKTMPERAYASLSFGGWD
ncbi:hypothetical protein [Antarcticimicrobium sediminis]|uniref:Uncharacterized protein n=1 Tax=Antarcticimicrobium sediminis TaxID=2546227 RepID=A0A4R5EUF1_9RHOB|nr:hypothetical protein [Antarcticimicrobium sediminis]TDE38494.1 hypothetical protein E1B25_10285 [Antarcticimicrobium sediminis]